MRGERAALFEFLATSPDGVCAHDSTFGFGDVLAAIKRWGPDGQPRPLPADQLIRVANEFLPQWTFSVSRALERL
jgi:hypothetical protein